MRCSENNFVQSQHFYGLCIAKQKELPKIGGDALKWLNALQKINRIAKLSAEMQISGNKPFRRIKNGRHDRK